MSRPDALKSILLVDDDEASNFLHSIFINKLELDVSVNTALNGQEALDFILNKGMDSLPLPCMVLLDLRMPIMDGWQFMEMYRKQVPKVIKDKLKVVLVTISDDAADKAKAEQDPHIVDYALKPLSDQTFKELIKKHYSLKQMV